MLHRFNKTTQQTRLFDTYSFNRSANKPLVITFNELPTEHTVNRLHHNFILKTTPYIVFYDKNKYYTNIHHLDNVIKTIDKTPHQTNFEIDIKNDGTFYNMFGENNINIKNYQLKRIFNNRKFIFVNEKNEPIIKYTLPENNRLSPCVTGFDTGEFSTDIFKTMSLQDMLKPVEQQYIDFKEKRDDKIYKVRRDNSFLEGILHGSLFGTLGMTAAQFITGNFTLLPFSLPVAIFFLMCNPVISANPYYPRIYFLGMFIIIAMLLALWHIFGKSHDDKLE